MKFGEMLQLFIIEKATWIASGIVAIIVGLFMREKGSDILAVWHLKGKGFQYSPYFYTSDKKDAPLYKIENIKGTSVHYINIINGMSITVRASEFKKMKIWRVNVSKVDLLAAGINPNGKSGSNS